MSLARIGVARISFAGPAAAVLAALVTACSQGAGPAPGSPAAASRPALTGSATDAATPTAPAGDRIEGLANATLEVEGGPDWPIEAFGSLWLLTPDGAEPAVVRIDPDANEVVARVPLPPGGCQGLGASDESIWACTSDGAVRIDPATNEIAGSVTYDAGATYGRLAFGAGAIWAIGFDAGVPDQLVRIDQATEEVTAVPLGHAVGTIAFGFDAVWATAPSAGLLLRIDPASGDVAEHAGGLPSPWVVAVGPDAIWLTLHGSEGDDAVPGDATVARIDPVDGALLAEIGTEAPSGSLGGVWAGEEAVWVRAPDAFLTEIDPGTNEVVRTIHGPPSSGEVTVAFGSVWATAVEGDVVFRLEP